MVFKYVGFLDFELPNLTKKQQSQSSWKRTAMIKTYDDLDQYYVWFLEKRFHVDLNKNLRGSHVTIINDRLPFEDFQQAATLFQGKPCEFYLDIEPRFNGKHWWLRAYSPMAESIRQACGLTPEPYFSFHLTLGHIKDGEHHQEKAAYLLRQLQNFELISNSPRLALSEHQIL